MEFLGKSPDSATRTAFPSALAEELPGFWRIIGISCQHSEGFPRRDMTTHNCCLGFHPSKTQAFNFLPTVLTKLDHFFVVMTQPCSTSPVIGEGTGSHLRGQKSAVDIFAWRHRLSGNELKPAATAPVVVSIGGKTAEAG